MSRLLSVSSLLLLCLTAVACQPNCADIVFPEPSESPYILPFPQGEAHLLSQSCCNPWGGHRNRIAYDFAMPIGSPIVAARDGEVIEVIARYRDGDLTRGHNNRVLIRHSDQSVAWYGHLQQGSVVVTVGSTVAAGERIASCGNSGNTGNLPHLHFEVFQSIPYDYADAVPVSFRNAPGPRDKRGALEAGATYTAGPGN